MPTIRTIISDLYNRRSAGLTGAGMLGATGGATIFNTLSQFYRVKMEARPVTVSFGGGPNHLTHFAAAPIGTANGMYLFFADDWSTVATLNRSQRIVAGGGYSGCLYSVYSTGNGDYKCVHTARPNGASRDAYVAGIRAYAADQHWTLVHEVPSTGGVGVNGCVTTSFVTRVSYTIAPTPIVRTVRLRENAQGLTVGQTRFMDASA